MQAARAKDISDLVLMQKQSIMKLVEGGTGIFAGSAGGSSYMEIAQSMNAPGCDARRIPQFVENRDCQLAIVRWRHFRSGTFATSRYQDYLWRGLCFRVFAARDPRITPVLF